jgi:hypothetical protein
VFYAVLADLIVAVHLAYVGFVVVGQLLIVPGAIFGWGWIRNPWFRTLHLLAILVVAGEAFAGIPCPLTVWEDKLRELADQAAQGGTFIGRLLDFVMFPPGLTEAWSHALYYGFALLVLATFVLAPPRRLRRFPADAGLPVASGPPLNAV